MNAWQMRRAHACAVFGKQENCTRESSAAPASPAAGLRFSEAAPRAPATGPSAAERSSGRQHSR